MTRQLLNPFPAIKSSQRGDMRLADRVVLTSAFYVMDGDEPSIISRKRGMDYYSPAPRNSLDKGVDFGPTGHSLVAHTRQFEQPQTDGMVYSPNSSEKSEVNGPERSVRSFCGHPFFFCFQ